MRPTRVSLLLVPDAAVSTTTGIYDVLNTVAQICPETHGFAPEIVAPEPGGVATASGLTLPVDRAIAQADDTELIVLPSLMRPDEVWETGRYPQVVAWLAERYARGVPIYAACNGVLLLAETGLLDGRQATIHWAYARTFRANFPNVRLRAEKILLATGDNDRIVMSGASASWHDLVLYLIARRCGPAAARACVKFFLLQWHQEAQSAYALFQPPTDHGDAAVRDAQAWLERHYVDARPVEQVAAGASLPERSFKRRFKRATGHTPIDYVQRLRTEDAKQRLEATDAPIDDIAWAVGYENPAFFRRLFKRLTSTTPSAYRRKFRLPEFRAP